MDHTQIGIISRREKWRCREETAQTHTHTKYSGTYLKEFIWMQTFTHAQRGGSILTVNFMRTKRVRLLTTPVCAWWSELVTAASYRVEASALPVGKRDHHSVCVCVCVRAKCAVKNVHPQSKSTAVHCVCVLGNGDSESGDRRKQKKKEQAMEREEEVCNEKNSPSMVHRFLVSLATERREKVTLWITHACKWNKIMKARHKRRSTFVAMTQVTKFDDLFFFA